jgi:hypothetical protein
LFKRLVVKLKVGLQLNEIKSRKILIQTKMNEKLTFSQQRLRVL